MKRFLGLVAEDLLARVQDFENLTLVFPNKRAALFMAEELKSCTDKVMWMPQVITCNDLIYRDTRLTLIDEVEGVVKLYKIFRKFQSELDLSEFYYWGKMLLADFDDVDKYLVDAHDLFGNVDKYRQMEDTSLSYLSGEQRSALKRFFDIVATSNSNETTGFQDIWNNIESVYNQFKALLKAENKAYAGMAQREFVERELWPDVKHIAFVGFNALNSCEKRIFAHYRDNGSALFYWDYDTYYTENEHHEAGHYMRGNLKSFPNALGQENFNRLSRDNNIELTVVDVPNVIAQTKLLSGLLPKGAGRESAVVLCDETLLSPVKNSFPEHIENINVTMGFPAKNSSVITLLDSLYNVTVDDCKNDTYYFKHVVKVLENPLISFVDRDGCGALIEEINREHMYRVPKDRLQFNPILSAVFNSETDSVPLWLNNILQAILLEPSLKDRTLDREVLFKMYTYIQRLNSLFVQEGIMEQVSENGKFYMSLINRMVSYTSVPFSGQPLQGVQLMGMMETRMLDFENLILLSVNEGIMPKAGVAPSFIPVSFRRAFGLPVPEHQDAIFAYYFYRLLQRVKRAVLVYVSGNGNGMGSEMSRFILQLKYESNIKINWLSLRNDIVNVEHKDLAVERTDMMMTKLKRMYRDPKKGRLSPSALSTYITCPLKFMRQFVEGLKEYEEAEDELDARMVGNYLHYAADILYSELNEKSAGGLITKRMLADVLENDTYISNVLERAYCKVMDPNERDANAKDGLSAIGQNVIQGIVVERYLRSILEYDMNNVAPFRILKLEEDVSMAVPMDDGSVIYIGGIVDRIDKLESGEIRVIDYKTGGDKREYSTLYELFEIGSEKHAKAPFQTMLYSMAYIKQNDLSGNRVVPGVYVLREMGKDGYDYHFISKDDGVIEEFSPEMQVDFMRNLENVIYDMYREGGNVGVAAVDKSCEYCTFKALCNKV